MTETVGFDCRQLGARRVAPWGAARREAFLLVPDFAPPMSVDPMSWPSVFDGGMGSSFSAPYRESLGLAGAKLPDFIGPRSPFWESIEELEAAVLKLELSPDESMIIKAVQCDQMLSPFDPTSNQSFSFLGFDVADQWFVSSLSNCGYDLAEREELRRRFAHQLDRNHLFSKFEAAIDFAATSNMLVPEHAPFYVYLLARRD